MKIFNTLTRQKEEFCTAGRGERLKNVCLRTYCI